MTKVRAMRRGDHYAVHARGHATGSPQVCAAISGLLYALAGYARNAGSVSYTHLTLPTT